MSWVCFFLFLFSLFLKRLWLLEHQGIEQIINMILNIPVPHM